MGVFLTMIQLNEATAQLLCEGIANHFGSSCEIVFHDLTREYDHTIIAIANGHVTKRTVGGPGTSAGLNAIMKVSPDNNCETYINHTDDGRVLKSTSIYFRDEKDQIVASLCINQDISDLLCIQNNLTTFLNNAPAGDELFSNDISDVLDSMINESVMQCGKPVIRMTREDKIEVIRYLDAHGAFLVKRSTDRLCARLKISKNSFYAYLEDIRREA